MPHRRASLFLVLLPIVVIHLDAKDNGARGGGDDIGDDQRPVPFFPHPFKSPLVASVSISTFFFFLIFIYLAMLGLSCSM